MEPLSQHTTEHPLMKLKSRCLGWWGYLTSRGDYAVGIFILLIVVFLWTSSNFVTQDLLDEGYQKPFLITYLSTATFILYLVPYTIRQGFDALKSNNGILSKSGTQGYLPLSDDARAAETLGAQDSSDEVSLSHHSDALLPLTVRETAQLAAWFCLIWFVANWTLNVGLGYTSVASATILAGTSGFFTLALGRLFHVETLTLVKIISVAASFGGVILVSLSDSQQGERTPPVDESDFVTRDGFRPPPILGDTLALLSALFYAIYVTLLKVRVRSESRMDMQLFFGFVGLFNVMFCWPIGVVLHVVGVERFELPTSKATVVRILVNMAITLSSDYLYVLAMLKTTPLVVTIGLSLTMPLAVIGDLFRHKPVTFQVILGAVIVLFSFVAIGLEDSHNEEEKDLIAGKPLEPEGNRVHLEEDLVLEPHESENAT